MKRARPEGCLSDLVLDRIVNGELPREGEPGAHLAGCEACRARLEAFEAAARDFGEVHFVAKLAAQATAAVGGARPWRVRMAVAAAGLAAAAAVLLLVTRPPSEGVRTKGGLSLEVVARHADGRVETVLPGATLAPGDAIRFRVTNPTAGYLAIVGADAARQVTAYVPARMQPSGRGQLLEGSVILDETRGAERLTAVLCPRAIADEELLAAARRALEHAGFDPRAQGPLDLDCEQAAVLLEKK